MEPTPEQLEEIHSLGDLAKWAKLTHTPAAGSWPVDHPGSMAGSLFVLMGTPPEPASNMPPPDTQWSELCQFANIDPDDFAEELKQWQFADMTNGMEATGPEREGEAYEANLTVRPKPAEKGFARAAYGAARIRCGIVPSRAKLKSEADYKTFLKQTTVEAVATAAAEAQADKAAALKEKVKLSEVVDVTLAAEIPLIPDDEYDVLWQRFRVVMSRVPEEEEAPSQQQLTALRHLLLVASAYVDFATWCAYHFRTLKAFKCAGMIPGPPDANGAQTFMQQEFKGPPEYSFWWKAWRVYQAAMIMAEACMPTFLKRYATYCSSHPLTSISRRGVLTTSAR